MTAFTIDLREFPADVQDMLRDRAIKERKPIGDIIAEYVVEAAKAIIAASNPSAA